MVAVRDHLTLKVNNFPTVDLPIAAFRFLSEVPLDLMEFLWELVIIICHLQQNSLVM